MLHRRTKVMLDESRRQEGHGRKKLWAYTSVSHAKVPRQIGTAKNRKWICGHEIWLVDGSLPSLWRRRREELGVHCHLIFQATALFYGQERIT
jgi:hypothetical protein